MMKNPRFIFAYNPNDSEDVRLEKIATFLVSGSCTLAGSFWTAMYFAIFGWGFITLLPVCFVILVGGAILISHFTRNHYYTIYTQIICIIYIPTLLQWNIGGVFDSGIVLAWAFVGPICALMFFSIKQSIPWFLLFLVNLVITVLFNGFFASRGQIVTDNTKLFFFIMNLGFASTVVFIFASYYVNAAVKEQKKSSKLLEANLQQEMILRENEKLATLGKLSAGVAHELNNPAYVFRPVRHLDGNDILNGPRVSERMTGRTDPANALDHERRLVKGLPFGKFLDASMVVSDPNVNVDDLLPFHRKSEKLRFFL